MAEFQDALGAPEIVRQWLPSGLRDHPWAREVELRSRLGDTNIGQRCEAGQNASCAGVGQYGQKRRSRLVHQIDRARCLGHLHEAQDSLLHARPPGAADRDERQLLGARKFGAAPDTFAHHAAHAAAHVAEIHDCQNAVDAIDATCSGDNRL
jgi:hypothetical protein